MKLYTIGQFSKAINRTTQTIRNWDNTGYLKPHVISKGGHRYYSQEQVNQLKGLSNTEQASMNIGYVRVSSNHQKDDLERQKSLVETYLIQQGQPFIIIEDIGSGINYDKQGLNQLIETIVTQNINKVIVLHKDRLVRFGYELLSNLFNQFDTQIEIINQNNQSDEQELVEDLIQIVTVFSSRLNGKRSHQSKRFISELKSDD